MAEDAQIREIINKHAEYMNGLDRGQGFFGQEAVINMVRTALDLRAAEHDARVTDLIRANSQNVIERRYWKARAKLAEEKLHAINDEWIKYDPANEDEWSDGYEDALGEMAKQCRETLVQIMKIKPKDFGKP